MSDWVQKGPLERVCRRVAGHEVQRYRTIADREFEHRRTGDKRTRDDVLRDVIEGFNPGCVALPQIEDGSFILVRTTQ